MAIPKIFKPFHHEPSKQVYFDVADSHHNPILIAHKEYEIIWTGYGFAPKYPDIVVSIGTGLETKPRQNTQDTSRKSIVSRKKGRTGKKSQQAAFPADHHDFWDDYLNLLPVSTPESKSVRLNPVFDDLPAPDDIGGMKSLQSLVQKYVNKDQVKRIAAQLFATLFYFESSDTILETLDNQLLVQGKLPRLCSRSMFN
jgi:hypothetical protein